MENLLDGDYGDLDGTRFDDSTKSYFVGATNDPGTWMKLSHDPGSSNRKMTGLYPRPLARGSKSVTMW